jgi:glucosyltransferase
LKQISILVPCYNEEENIRPFWEEIRRVFREFFSEHYTLELLYIDDGSRDGTLERIRELAEEDPDVKYLSFSRNFGKEAALYAGLEHASGDYVAVMDVDLQDPPSLLPEMAEALESGEYDVAATRREDRKGEPPVRSFFARLFYRLIRKISDVDIVDGARDFRLMTRQYVESLLELKEYNRFSKGLFGWVGYRVKWIAYENIKREKGSTKWSFWKLFLYSIDGIVAFSVVPAVMAAAFGAVFCVAAFLFLFVVFVRAMIYGDPVAGWPSLVCIILFVSGIQFFFMGVLGEYMAKTYMEVKRRPVYLCRESNLEPVKGEKERLT